MSKIDDIRAQMQTLTDFIIAARDDVRSGKMVDLKHLDGTVASICERTLSLPPQQAGEIQPLMAEMIGYLEELGAALKDYQDQFDPKNRH
jgi:hypothetical protein